MKNHRKRIYGLSEEEFQRLLAEQDGCCAICDKRFVFPSPSRYESPHVDHNHAMADKNESIRGILCTRCNRLIGLAEDNPAILRAAAEYLDA